MQQLFEFLDRHVDPDDQNDQAQRPYTPGYPVKIHENHSVQSLILKVVSGAIKRYSAAWEYSGGKDESSI